jgi:hypothetical protein
MAWRELCKFGNETLAMIGLRICALTEDLERCRIQVSYSKKRKYSLVAKCTDKVFLRKNQAPPKYAPAVPLHRISNGKFGKFML